MNTSSGRAPRRGAMITIPRSWRCMNKMKKTTIMISAIMFAVLVPAVLGVTNTASFNYLSLTGANISVSNLLTVAAVGSQPLVAATNQSANGQTVATAVVFGCCPFPVATNGFNPGDWILWYTISANSNTPASTTFKVTFQAVYGPPGATFYGPIYIASPASVSTTGISFVLSFGPSLSPPLAYSIAITRA
jgi:hypothetical protein